MRNLKTHFGLLTCALFIAACSSEPSVSELPITTDPNLEISKIEQNLVQAQAEQVDVLSPANYKNAKEALQKAKDDQGKNKDQRIVLHDIALAETYLDQAIDKARVATQVMPEVVAERKNAVTAEAFKWDRKEFEIADSALKDATKDIEKGKLKTAEKIRGKLARAYNQIELTAIRAANIGEANNIVEQARNEGAKKFVPHILGSTEKQITADEASIINDRHNSSVIAKASADAKAAASRLLILVREAKKSAQQNPEQLATEFEQRQLAAEAAKKEANTVKGELENKQGDLAVLAAEKSKLEAQNALEKRYEFAAQQFSKDEAEVYKQGNKILIRLKGLSFPKDQAIITSNNYPLLAKVQTILKENKEDERITIEGHTDSTGTKIINQKLSTERAKAVEDYLKANNAVTEDKVTAAGFGFSKPIASNKTRAGRAQNRRVDIIITEEPTNSQTDQNQPQQPQPTPEQQQTQ